MAGNAEGAFPDLLSAALGESGITEENKKDKTVAENNAANPKNGPEANPFGVGDGDDFDDVDIFTQALQQLTETSIPFMPLGGTTNESSTDDKKKDDTETVKVSALPEVVKSEPTASSSPVVTPTPVEINNSSVTYPVKNEVKVVTTQKYQPVQTTHVTGLQPTQTMSSLLKPGPVQGVTTLSSVTASKPVYRTMQVQRPPGTNAQVTQGNKITIPMLQSGTSGGVSLAVGNKIFHIQNKSGSNALGSSGNVIQMQSQIPAPVSNVIRLQSNTRVGSPTLRQVIGATSSSFPSSGGRVIQVQAPGTLNRNTNSPVMVIQPDVVKAPLTQKDVSRMWANDDIKLKNLNAAATPRSQSPAQQSEELEEEAELENEELGHAETYAEYMPAKLKLGVRHPDSVVETSSLSSVEPVDVWYRLSIPEHIIDYGELSALQLESIVYACQKHECILPNGERAGFLIGDGAGVGKGRTIAGVIYENYLQGRKRALWLSVSNDLKVDAERDLRDIGAEKLHVYSLNKFKYAKLSSKENGSVKKGVIFATYSSLIGESQGTHKYRTRMKQLLHWCGHDFDGVIVFDECHKAKNLCPVGSSKPTKTGLSVLELQKKLPKARIIYASATGASEPKNMAYMTRLGLWGEGTAFREFNDFIQAVERRGVGAMELVAMDMKLRGMYIARQLSFHGVTFRVEEVPLEKSFVKMYNEAVKLWILARERFQQAADLMDAEKQMRKSMWGQFWSAHQRFFKYLCISAKVKHCVGIARDAVKNGKCVVIGLQSTGEARTLEQLEESGGELTDFVSTAKGVFQTLVEKHFPAPNRRKAYDLFGIGKSSSYSAIFDDSPVPSPLSMGGKRKNDGGLNSDAKRLKEDSDSSSISSGTSSPSSSGSESDIESGEDSDFNPFAAGSDSDDDPWLKKTKKKQKKKKKKKEKKKKKIKSKKPKENKYDQALEAAGLKSYFGSLTRDNSSTNLSAMNSTNKNSMYPAMDSVEKAQSMKQELLDTLEEVGDKFPPNTLDELIDLLGGPENVAEMTGRKGRVVSNDDGGVSYESRSEMDVPLEILNLTEKQRFMDGEKDVAIISEAASSGISLQADRRVANQKRRVHITLELPWSADRAIQQFGRTHRSNQVSAPEYIFLISELAGEKRFASTVAKRLESLGALTHGDRRATESRDLSRFNFDNKYGRTALELVMKAVLELESPMVAPPATYQGHFFQDVLKALVGVGMVTVDERFSIPTLEKDYNNISKFLNRILGVEIEVQNHLFKYFSDTMTAIILQAKKNGRWDMGILDLGSGGENVKIRETKSFTSNLTSGKVKSELHTVSVERGLGWLAALDIWKEHYGSHDGFYVSKNTRLGKPVAILVVAMSGKKKGERLYSVYRPNTGLQLRSETLDEIKKKYKKVVPDEAQFLWLEQYDASVTVCTHAYWRGNCKKISVGLPCEVGLRSRTYHVLSGSVLNVWGKVESVLASVPGGHQARMQVVRLKTEDGKRIVGSLIPSNAVTPLCNALSTETADATASLAPNISNSRIIGTTSLSQGYQDPGTSHPYLSMPMFV